MEHFSILKIIRVLFSVTLFLSLGILLSENKKKISYSLLLKGSLTNLFLIFLSFRLCLLKSVLTFVDRGLLVIHSTTLNSLEFLLGDLSSPSGNMGFILAIHGFIILITISVLSSVLHYLGILPIIIKPFSLIFRYLFNTSGPLGFGVVANIFVGQSETPILIRPYLKTMSRSELFAMMTCGASGLSTGIIIIINNMMKLGFPNINNIIIISLITSIPTALIFSRIVIPQEEKDSYKQEFKSEKLSSGLLDSIYKGTMEGASLYIRVVLMLLSFIFLINLLNQIILILNFTDHELSLQIIMGWIFYPISWLIGIDFENISEASNILATRNIFNELLAYKDFASIVNKFSYKNAVLTICSISNFANFGSLGVIVGVYTSIIPERQKEIMSLAVKALITANLAILTNTTLIGIFL